MKQPDLGFKIIELRQTKGLTQEELVKQCNISVRTLQRIESGEVEPRGYTLRLISKVLDFDFFSLSQNDSDHNSKASKSDDIINLDKARAILIKRYALLSNSSVDKLKTKLETIPIEDIIEKHNKVLTLSIVLVIMVSISVIVLFVSLYLAEHITIILVLNVLVLVVFLKGLHDNYEIKNILKALKEIG
ncbi:helix-turn-helix domain-containing protein [Sunxiuqinia sp. A32]|uniref:helix-turn-helix domain-containing protein n=1 Tax=Sunxiuqinia sp. A32 TaxID=3461496 RepID=UPI00404610FE